MTKHASNSERIARAAAESEATALERMGRKMAAGKTATPRARPAPRAKTPARLKVEWAVGRPGGVPVTTFPYSDRAGADAEAARRGGDYRVVAIKVPME